MTKFKHVSTAKVLEGLGLSGEQLRIARLRLSVVGPPLAKGQDGSVPSGRQPAFAPTQAPVIKPVVVKPPVVKPAPVVRKPAVGPLPATRRALAAAAPVTRKPIVRPVTVTVKVVVKPVVVIRKPVVKPVAAVLHRVPRPQSAPAVPVAAVRIPRVRHPVAAAATSRERQATATSPSAVYNIANLHINRPVGDPRQLEDQLQKRTRSRANVRRGA